MKQCIFDVTREDIERYVTIGFDLAIKTMVNNGTITQKQADEYANYTCTSISNKSVVSRLASFFGKDIPPNDVVFKFIAFKLHHTKDEFSGTE
jgi:hypothetical protein